MTEIYEKQETRQLLFLRVMTVLLCICCIGGIISYSSALKKASAHTYFYKVDTTAKGKLNIESVKYKVRLTTREKVKFTATAPKPLRLSLYSSSGKLLSKISHYKSHGPSEKYQYLFYQTLNAGTYYITLDCYAGTGLQYCLEISTDAGFVQPA